MIQLTMFKSTYDNVTENVITIDNFDSFYRLMVNLSKQPIVKPKMGEPINFYHAPLISPAIYKHGTTRSNDNVIRWSKWAALDVDDFEGDIKSIDCKNYSCVVYSTASSTKDKPKFRMVFPLTEEVPKENIADFWFALNTEMDNIGDIQVKDLSRMYYIPGHYPDAYNFIFKNETNQIISPKELILKHPRPKDEFKSIFSSLSGEMQKELMEKRLDKKKKTYIWSSYKDCPFINKELLLEYKSITGTGWYHKLYSIMVSIAMTALKMDYPIQPYEIEKLVEEIHLDTRGWPTKRKLNKEVDRALAFALKNL